MEDKKAEIVKKLRELADTIEKDEPEKIPLDQVYIGFARDFSEKAFKEGKKYFLWHGQIYPLTYKSDWDGHPVGPVEEVMEPIKEGSDYLRKWFDTWLK